MSRRPPRPSLCPSPARAVAAALSVALIVAITCLSAALRAQPAPAPAPSKPSPAQTQPGPPAQPAPSPGAAASDAPPAPAPPSEEAKRVARAHFEKGISLLQQGVWTVALAEFLISRELFPTRNATNNAAVCLRKLQRYDEALDMFETLLRDFPSMPADDKLAAQRAIAELRGLVGTIEITDSEPGAAIVISGQNRSDYPPISPLRVSAGTHIVRVFKEGYEPFEGRVDVPGGWSVRVAAKLTKLKESGRLRVTERSGMTLDVVVDNVVVGTTPWEGLLGVGNHTVVLLGKGKIGTAPASAPVKAEQLTTLSLRAERLDASMRVEPSPPGASVAINSVTVGRGAWAGLLKSGTHRVEVREEGFLPVVRQIQLAKGEREVVSVRLERDEDSDFWRKPPKFTVELGAALALAPSLGGEVEEGCGADCSKSVGIGALTRLHAGYELGAGPGLGLTVGYLRVGQTMEGRAAEIVPVNLAPKVGSATDSLVLSGFLVGATGSLRIGEQFPVLLRVGVGALLGSIRDERTGTFTTRGGASYETYPVDDKPAARYLFIDPEARVGVRFAGSFVASAGVQALLLVAPSPPKWSATKELRASTDGIATYPAETLTGGFVFMIAPSASLRYEF